MSSWQVQCYVSCNFGLTEDILDHHEQENVVNVEVELGEDHTGDVGWEEDQGQAEDTNEILSLHFSCVWSEGRCLLDSVDQPEDEVDQPGHQRAGECGEDDGEEDGGEAEVAVRIVTHRAGNVHLITAVLASVVLLILLSLFLLLSLNKIAKAPPAC